jgi:hypothetical protein
MTPVSASPRECKILPIPIVLKTDGNGQIRDVIDGAGYVRKKGRPPGVEGPLQAEPDHIRMAKAVAGVFSEERPRLREASQHILATFFKQDRLRHDVAYLVASALDSSFRVRQVSDPSGPALVRFLKDFPGISEIELLETFNGWNKDEEYLYRVLLEDRAKTALGEYQILDYDALPIDPSPPTTDRAERDKEYAKRLMIYKSEWDAVRLWCHYLWLLIK